MENFNTLLEADPALIITTGVLAINYVVKSIHIENTGNENGLVIISGVTNVIEPGRSVNMVSGGYYAANKFSVNPKETPEAVATRFTITINK